MHEYCLNEAKKYNYKAKDLESLAQDGLRFQNLGEYVEFAKNFLNDEDFKDYLDELLHLELENEKFTQLKHFSKYSIKQIYKIAQKGWQNYNEKYDGNIIAPPLESLISLDEAFALSLIKNSLEAAFSHYMQYISNLKRA